MKALAKRLLPKPLQQPLLALKNRWFTSYSRKSYAQEGEDMLLDRFLENRPHGFYVDVGAHHPERFSNTYRLYRRGWRGLNIDAIPGSMAVFRRKRPRDVNIEMAVAASREELTFYVFNEPALNTFERDLAIQRVSAKYKIIQEIKLAPRPLSELLDEYVPAGTKLDILTVDVEGLDYDVLRSNDWDKYRPDFVLAECFGAITAEETTSHIVYKFLFQLGYRMVAKTMNTVVFQQSAGVSG
jgi:FkbM family methyltransferase